ncbi:carbohydrate ABC transporter permease [Paenibacillus roseipurpureus]|uniref:Sugar ABC transporter permease n=1 Tax=Paenibacillus roseopurpureus TaxID=2918901 RepID=A0AA96LPU5_9BACL|nr:sugar ABC transporter permease [Paenibacillus sp. MBLB1832]WNR46037.1 sugar ABC transporter permease [Paenibacillus sp. MBLB1832]
MSDHAATRLKPNARKNPLLGKKLTESQFGFLLVLPALLVFMMVIFYPFINSLYMSMTNQSLLKQNRSFVGLDNFKQVFTDPDFLAIIKNTLIFVAGGTLAPFVLGLIWAIVLNQGFKGAEILRGLTLVAWIVPSTAIGFLWMWIFHAQYGVLNGVLSFFGLIDNNINWLGQTETSMMVVIIAKSWQTLPWFMAFLLGGLQGVSTEQVEAARIDGAGNWQVLRHVVLPDMKEIISLVLLLGTIGSLQHFDLPWVMTQGGPATSTTTLSIAVYRSAFQEFNLGNAAAIGAVWVVLLGVFGYFYLRNASKDA